VYLLYLFLCEDEIKHHFKLEKEIPTSPEEVIYSLSEWLSIASSKGQVVRSILHFFENT
jgi:hypothetical protein